MTENVVIANDAAEAEVYRQFGIAFKMAKRDPEPTPAEKAKAEAEREARMQAAFRESQRREAQALIDKKLKELDEEHERKAAEARAKEDAAKQRRADYEKALRPLEALLDYKTKEKKALGSLNEMNAAMYTSLSNEIGDLVAKIARTKAEYADVLESATPAPKAAPTPVKPAQLAGTKSVDEILSEIDAKIAEKRKNQTGVKSNG